jgi:hypothetical protein
VLYTTLAALPFCVQGTMVRTAPCVRTELCLAFFCRAVARWGSGKRRIACQSFPVLWLRCVQFTSKLLVLCSGEDQSQSPFPASSFFRGRHCRDRGLSGKWSSTRRLPPALWLAATRSVLAPPRRRDPDAFLTLAQFQCGAVGGCSAFGFREPGRAARGILLQESSFFFSFRMLPPSCGASL